MKIIEYNYGESLSDLKKRLSFSESGCVMALGFFDGVHIAHRSLISRAKEEAVKLSIPLVIFTFSGKNNLFKKSAERIYTDEEKYILLKECGADYTLVCDFNAISEFSKETFVSDFLINCTNTKTAVCGFNFRFGKNAQGNADDMSALLSDYGRKTLKIQDFLYEGESVSSTKIREFIKSKNISSANLLLGKPYFISGKVCHGLGIGSGMGLPTININIPDGKFIVPKGVYATRLKIENKWYSSLTNVGICPTFGERNLHLETFILNFNEIIYGSNVEVYFIEFLREEKVFSSQKELIMQIKIDKNKTIDIMRGIKWQEIGLN